MALGFCVADPDPQPPVTEFVAIPLTDTELVLLEETLAELLTTALEVLTTVRERYGVPVPTLLALPGPVLEASKLPVTHSLAGPLTEGMILTLALLLPTSVKEVSAVLEPCRLRVATGLAEEVETKLPVTQSLATLLADAEPAPDSVQSSLTDGLDVPAPVKDP